MIITFLGTGTSQGVPVVACQCRVCKSINEKDKRLRTSILIENQTDRIVIDSGPDFRQQMLRENVSYLSGLVFTHAHKDHTAGMDDIRGFNFVQQQPTKVYATQFVQECLKKEYHYIFNGPDYPGLPQVQFHTITNQKFSVANTELIPIEVLHHKLPVLGFRIGKFTYITDANFISEESKQKISGSEVLVLNALRKEKHISHFNLNEAIALATELNVKTTYFTHISHQMGFHESIENELPTGMHLAYDGLKIEID